MSVHRFLVEEKTILHYQNILTVYPFLVVPRRKAPSLGGLFFKPGDCITHMKQKEVQKQDICQKNRFSNPLRSIH